MLHSFTIPPIFVNYPAHIHLYPLEELIYSVDSHLLDLIPFPTDIYPQRSDSHYESIQRTKSDRTSILLARLAIYNMSASGQSGGSAYYLAPDKYVAANHSLLILRTIHSRRVHGSSNLDANDFDSQSPCDRNTGIAA
jgi:hypothetical protein